MPTHIYQRPLMDQGSWATTLRIVGQLVDYNLGESYEGRLQILNSIGPHFVKQTGGDPLPDGTVIRVDEETSEIVVSWEPLYRIPGSRNEYAAELVNADFEGEKGWTFGTGWKITTDNPITGSKSGVYQVQNGMSVLSHTARYKVIPGRAITAQCQVRQGASAEGNAGASVMLEWRDAQGSVLSRSEGNQVMSASKNRVYPSNLTAMPPDDAVYVNIAANGIRYKENKDLWVDNFKWDHVVVDVVEPVNPSEEYYLELEVVDSTGRIGRWKGSILLAGVYTTSKLYGFYDVDSLIVGADFAEFRSQEMGVEISPLSVGGVFVSMEVKSIRQDHAQPLEDLLFVGCDFVSIEIKNIRKDYVHAYDPDDTIQVSASFISIDVKQHPRTAQPLEDILKIGAQFISLEFGS